MLNVNSAKYDSVEKFFEDTTAEKCAEHDRFNDFTTTQQFLPRDTDSNFFYQPRTIPQAPGGTAIPRESDLPTQWIDKLDPVLVQNAVMLSSAAYKDNPKEFLEDQRTNGKHTFKKVIASTKTECVFIIAEDPISDTIYCAFRGSKTSEDFVTDLQIYPTLLGNAPESRVHSGFLNRAKMFPLQTLLTSQLFSGSHQRNLVLCGHSLGGAVSSVLFLLLLQEQRNTYNLLVNKVTNITFGSPLFGTTELKTFFQKEVPNMDMYHFIAENDPIPGLILLVQELKKRSLEQTIYQNLLRAIKASFRVGLELSDGNKKIINQAIKILSNQYATRVSPSSYCPIGNFMTLSKRETIETSNSEVPFIGLTSLTKLLINNKDSRECHGLINYKTLVHHHFSKI